MDNKISIANLPTKIEKLEKISTELGVNIFFKRDDQTGTEVSGNKVRKLEYAIKEAIDQGCDTLITCGGIQSNHARSTAAAAIKAGLSSVLVLRTNEEPELDGNYFIDKVLGADIKFITSDEYSNSRQEIMESIKEDLKAKGKKGYIIPEGASNGIGSLGYINFVKEVLEFEEKSDIKFDTIVVAVGSGGTYAGIHMGNDIYLNGERRVVGFNVCDSAEFFKERVKEIIDESKSYLNERELKRVEAKNIDIIDGYVGEGYALSTQNELNFIWELAKKEGVILDPVYTGKAMYGLYNEIKKGSFEKSKNILFVHTGGLFGLFPKKTQFEFKN